jgi:putative two-component system response regulator
MEKKLIVMVDDNPVSLQSGISVLSVDYRVATVPSAAKFYEFLETNVPDIVLLDIDMPDVDGYQVIQTLKFKKETQDIPVIFLTGMTEPTAEIKGLSLGAVDFITKPFNPAALLKSVETYLK